MNWIFVVGLAIASSIDNVATGLAYGLRGMRIGTLSNLVIAAICFGFSLAGLELGAWLGSVLPGRLPSIASAFLLFGIGLRLVLWTMPRSTGAGPQAGQPPAGSPGIGLWETLALGVALSANALTNAVGAGLMALPAFDISASAAVGSFLAIAAGTALGRRARRLRFGPLSVERFSTALSGLILIGLAAASLAR
ncbi:manganese efflux pump [Labrys wisconsinensis]|uniref:Mn2+ efflux pump MntP n=1 Tax=Labrys wisconsinensis TaxID=425677 RepID=A0ABU0J3L1_9HYPH|nr:manganese efflux pump [Labrys wisconsinensis]MDQ0468845.1 putative Mn2+ efflux pump MntP [Labrys wisconsinensis]